MQLQGGAKLALPFLSVSMVGKRGKKKLHNTWFTLAKYADQNITLDLR